MTPMQESSSGALRKPQRDAKEIRAIPDTDEGPEAYSARLKQKQKDMDAARQAEMQGEVELKPPRRPEGKQTPHIDERPAQEVPVINQNYFENCTTFSSIINQLEKMAENNEILYSRSGRSFDAKNLYSAIMDVRKGFEQTPIKNAAVIDSILAEKGITSTGGFRKAVIEAVLNL